MHNTTTNFHFATGQPRQTRLAHLKATFNHLEIDSDEGFDPSLNAFKLERGWMF